MSARFEDLIALDDSLAWFGVPPLGAWFRSELRAFYTHPTARTLAICAGRGSAKSTAVYKMALAETLFGAFEIPVGERHWAAISSVSRAEAEKGAAIIAHWLRLLRVPHSATTEVIELTNMPRGIRITAASVAGNSGWRAFFSANDEVGKWPSEGSAAVDAAEVMSSKRAQTVTHRTAREVNASTPFLDSGPFFEIVSRGSTEHVHVSGPAPTWVATDGRISEEQTHELERDPRKHAREYGASFAVEWAHGYFSGLVEPCVGDWTSLPPRTDRRYAIAIDPAFSRDLFAVAVVHIEGNAIVIDRVEALKPSTPGAGLAPTEAIQRVKEIARTYRVDRVVSDQHHAASLADIAAREGLTIEPRAWTATNKAPAFEQTRTLMRDGSLRLPNDPGLLRELSGIGVRLMPSGHEQISARSGYTDDRVSALVLAVSSVSGEWSRPGRRLWDAIERADLDSAEAKSRWAAFENDMRAGRFGRRF